MAKIYQYRLPFMTVVVDVPKTPDKNITIEIHFLRLHYLKEREEREERLNLVGGEISFMFYCMVLYDLILGGEPEKFFVSRGISPERARQLTETVTKIVKERNADLISNFALYRGMSLMGDAKEEIQRFLTENIYSLLGSVDPDILSLDVFPAVGARSEPLYPYYFELGVVKSFITVSGSVRVSMEIRTPRPLSAEEFPRWWMSVAERYLSPVLGKKEDFMGVLESRLKEKLLEIYAPEEFTGIWRNCVRRILKEYELTESEREVVTELFGEVKRRKADIYHAYKDPSPTLTRINPKGGRETNLTRHTATVQIEVTADFWNNVKGLLDAGNVLQFIRAVTTYLTLRPDGMKLYYVKGSPPVGDPFQDYVANIRQLMILLEGHDVT